MTGCRAVQPVRAGSRVQVSWPLGRPSHFTILPLLLEEPALETLCPLLDSLSSKSGHRPCHSRWSAGQPRWEVLAGHTNAGKARLPFPAQGTDVLRVSALKPLCC